MGKIVSLLSAPQLGFDCGDRALNRWFQMRAQSNEAAGFSRTHVMHTDSALVGFYTLSAAAIDIEPAALNEPFAPDPIPAILLGRMAVATQFQGLGVGKRLLLDALERANLVTQKVGAAVLVVHPKPNASGYYRAQGFKPLDQIDALYWRLGN